MTIEIHNNRKITLFVMTEKGYEFLRGTLGEYKSLYSQIVVGSDASLANDYESEIMSLCAKHNVSCIQKNNFKKISTEFVFAISWRWLIKHPAKKLIVFHDSLLPKYRGFSPLVNTLINGEKYIGVSAILGADEFDTGDIIAQSKSKVSYPITISSATKKNNTNYLVCAKKVLDMILTGSEITTKKQNNSRATYSVWRDELDYKIDWTKSACEISRLIDAVGYPYKGASSLLDGNLVRILKSEEFPDVKIENRDCGKVLFIADGKPIVICRTGMLKIVEANILIKNKEYSLFPLKKFRLRFYS